MAAESAIAWTHGHEQAFDIFAELDWVIAGGESGPKFRTFPGIDDAFRGIKTLCADTSTPFFFKQHPGPRPGMGEELDGILYREFPLP